MKRHAGSKQKPVAKLPFKATCERAIASGLGFKGSEPLRKPSFRPVIGMTICLKSSTCADDGALGTSCATTGRTHQHAAEIRKISCNRISSRLLSARSSRLQGRVQKSKVKRTIRYWVRWSGSMQVWLVKCCSNLCWDENEIRCDCHNTVQHHRFGFGADSGSSRWGRSDYEPQRGIFLRQCRSAIVGSGGLDRSRGRTHCRYSS